MRSRPSLIILACTVIAGVLAVVYISTVGGTSNSLINDGGTTVSEPTSPNDVSSDKDESSGNVDPAEPIQFLDSDFRDHAVLNATTVERALSTDSLKHVLPDVSEYARPFESTLSFHSLKEDTPSEVSYNVEIKTIKRLVINDEVSKSLGRFDGVMPTQKYKRELIFDKKSEDDQIVFEEKIYPEGSDSAEAVVSDRRVLGLDGRYMEPAENALKKHYKYLDPIFPEHSVGKGDKWNVRIAVDPELNPGGQVTAEMEILETFIKDDQKYVRVQMKQRFTYDPNPDLADSGENSGSPKKVCKSITQSIKEAYDLNLSTGVIENISNLQKILYEMDDSSAVSVKNDRITAMILQTTTSTTLESILR